MKARILILTILLPFNAFALPWDSPEEKEKKNQLKCQSIAQELQIRKQRIEEGRQKIQQLEGQMKQAQSRVDACRAPNCSSADYSRLRGELDRLEGDRNLLDYGRRGRTIPSAVGVGGVREQQQYYNQGRGSYQWHQCSRYGEAP